MTMRRVLLPHHICDRPIPPIPAGGAVRDFHGHSMGTTWSVRLVACAAATHLQGGLQGQLDAVVAEMSHWSADSNLARFNRAPAGSWHVLPVAFFTVLAFALNVARESDGAYHPAAGALVNLWGFGPDRRFEDATFQAPAPEQVGALLARVGSVELDHAGRRARQPGGMLLDLSAVAKGYSVDRLALYLEAQGVHHYLVEVGGELRGAGTKPDGQPWWVALEAVNADAAEAQAGIQDIVLALHGLSVATSGDYRRYFQRGAQRFSHTIDPRSGAPIDNGIASVTVVHAECMAADAWSTALTVLGLEAGMALAERCGLAARFMVRTEADTEANCALSEHMSSALRSMLEP